MTRRVFVLLAVVALFAGCSEAKDAAKDAASSAASEVGDAAAAEVKGRVCAPVMDGQISERDKVVLAGLVEAAKAADLPADVTTPLDEIAQSGDTPPAESVTALKEACE